MVHRGNEAGILRHGIAVMKATPRPDLVTGRLVEQGGMFHVVLDGVRDGGPFTETTVVTAVQSVVDAHQDWDRCRELMHGEALSLVVSNTTQAGIVDAADDLGAEPPTSGSNQPESAARSPARRSRRCAVDQSAPKPADWPTRAASKRRPAPGRRRPRSCPSGSSGTGHVDSRTGSRRLRTPLCRYRPRERLGSGLVTLGCQACCAEPGRLVLPAWQPEPSHGGCEQEGVVGICKVNLQVWRPEPAPSLNQICWGTTPNLPVRTRTRPDDAATNPHVKTTFQDWS